MTLAATSRSSVLEPLSPKAPPAPQHATLSTIDGRNLSRGIIEIRRDGQCWSATLAQLDRPGVLATAYFVDGVRLAVLHFHDGRRVRARIAGTRFIDGVQRICEIEGIDPLD